MLMDEDDDDDVQDLHVLDPNGDLVLRVGDEVEEKPRAYLVCSKALARASPVFAKMLYGSFAERRPSPVGAHADPDWTVYLPEDRQQPLELLLDVAHGRFDRVPDRLDVARLYQLLVVAEKYDATGMTRPWARGWMEAVKQPGMQDPLLLGVAYELGDSQTFNNMAMKIATECLVDDDGDLVFGYAGDDRETYSFKLCNMEYLVPPGFIEDAASIRRTLLATMLEPYASLYTALKDGDRCTASPQDPNSGKRCDSILLGSLIRSFAARRIDLTAPNPATAYRGSASALQAVLLRLELYTAHSGFSHPPTTSFAFGQAAHPRFGFSLSACEHVLQSSLREGVERSLLVRGGMKFVQPKHQAYLQRQAAKTGLPYK
ncbi:Nuclear pore protein-like protein [Colletotrichum higginsianum IMI 349063]|uniref:Nuclear pore protein-like protein n=2 Tax=Colletotrichum higginsianum TaxID=80884 RepID=A0A1B7YAY7_COLHI|nr:Nuclear pore protein-like protein [Colletotrichum higginsianum IMI 349063]OBR09167.1 Nuclear pore protein-like protein [Colletotrichum higginsianum IMI 349063]TIC95504.1 hypothetical protein CH35J_008216 [Colletotrichum higginsianum]